MKQDNQTVGQSDNRQGPKDMHLAHRYYGAMCGHGALAAALGCSVSSVCVLCFADDLLAKKAWVNMPKMEEALLRFHQRGVRYRIIGRDFPQRGLALLQWTGPWTKPGVPARVACMHRHWVAVDGDRVWDANAEEWLSSADWREIATAMLPKKADGWTVARGYEITLSSSPPAPPVRGALLPS